MSARETSLEAYNTIKENGLLSHRRWQVYDLLFREGPLTAMEVWKKLGPHLANGTFSTRLSELQRMELVREVGDKPNPDSGMTAILWDVTAKMPIKIVSQSEMKIVYGLFAIGKDDPNMAFSSKEQALKYKMEKQISGVIHEFCWVK